MHLGSRIKRKVTLPEFPTLQKNELLPDPCYDSLIGVSIALAVETLIVIIASIIACCCCCKK